MRKKTNIESKEITLIVLLYILLQWEFWQIKIDSYYKCKEVIQMGRYIKTIIVLDY